MKSLLLGSISLITLGAGVASAADMPVKAPAPYVASDWSGFYVGASGGYAWDRSRINLAPIGGFLFVAALGTGEVPASTHYSSHSAIGGVQAGYNGRINDFVVGVEADISGTSLKASSTNVSIPVGNNPVITTSQATDLDWLATFRARLGYTPAPWLLTYATAGIAAGNVSVSTTTTIPLNGCTAPGNLFCTAGSESDVGVGWTAGGGVEALFATRWSAKLEYLHFDLGGLTYTTRTTSPVFPGIAMLNGSVHVHGDLVRLGLNYHFGP